jgi:IS30 family transposase
MGYPASKLSHSTIYRAVKDGILKKAYPANKYLRRCGKVPNRHNTATIKPGHTIHEQPACIENRAWFGDLEGDTVYGGVGKDAMLTLADRTSKLLYAALAGSRDSGVILDAFKRTLGDTLVNSVTLDNGSVFARYLEIADRHNTIVYFADSHSPR